MARVTIDDTVRTRLGDLNSFLELCDASGCVVGYFTPADDRSQYKGVDSPEDDEELDRRSREDSERPLDEILRDLDVIQTAFFP